MGQGLCTVNGFPVSVTLPGGDTVGECFPDLSGRSSSPQYKVSRDFYSVTAVTSGGVWRVPRYRSDLLYSLSTSRRSPVVGMGSLPVLSICLLIC